MDLAARDKWNEYGSAKDIMFEHTDTDETPWWVVPSDDKKSARLNCISHLLSLFPYVDVSPKLTRLKRRQKPSDLVRPPIENQRLVPMRYMR